MGTEPAHRAEVVIAGAGIAGIATAWQLAKRLGTTDAVLVDPRPPLTVTSDRPEANYRDWWPHPAMIALADRSIGLIEALLADGADFANDRRGYLYVTADAAGADALQERVERYLAAGLMPDAAELITDSGVLRRRYPHLAPEIRAAIFVRRAGSIDTVGLGRAMLARAEARGVRVLAGEVAGLDHDGGRVSAVRVTTEHRTDSIEASAFVNAAGPFAAKVASATGSDLPLETVLRQKVLIHDRLGIVPGTAPFTIGLDARDGRPPGVHIKPDESVVPDGIKLGWALDQTPAEPVPSPACPPEYPRHVLERASTIVPGLAAYLDGELPVVAHDGGFYARTPDGLPLIGPTAVDGTFTVSGLAGFGAMMAPAAGEVATAWILGDPPSSMASAFDPRRFVDAPRPAFLSDRDITGEL